MMRASIKKWGKAFSMHSLRQNLIIIRLNSNIQSFLIIQQTLVLNINILNLLCQNLIIIWHDDDDDDDVEDIVATLFKFGRKLTLLGSTTQVCY